MKGRFERPAPGQRIDRYANTTPTFASNSAVCPRFPDGIGERGLVSPTRILEYQTAGRNSNTRFGIGPRVGYNLALTDMVGVWPKIGFSYRHSNRSLSGPT